MADKGENRVLTVEQVTHYLPLNCQLGSKKETYFKSSPSISIILFSQLVTKPHPHTRQIIKSVLFATGTTKFLGTG
ncbi:MAG: hypothetical protein D3911_15740 [Candidatus Electrothrix sp. AW3_4]|nr:hypothetical protein [Candidatus Electrothrix gigas]